MNQMLNSIVEDIKDIIHVDCSVWNLKGRCLTSTSDDTDNVQEAVEKLIETYEVNEMYTENGISCFMVLGEIELLILAIHQELENVEMIGKLCANQMVAAIHSMDRYVDRSRFVQQLLLDNLLLVDIYSQAKKVNFEVQKQRIVYVIEPKKQRDDIVIETLKGMYENTDNVVTSVDEGKVVLLMDVEEDDVENVMEEAMAIADVVMTEAMTDVRVAYGTVVSELKDVSKSYKEAVMALNVGQIFYKEKKVLAYSELGIGRLIHQLPISLCEMFLQEVFKGNAMEQFDEETLATVNAFFENNLNISETSRKMYVHRNTLSYRLDKIMKMTGLDVKKFDDALTFKIALMVSDHMKYIKTQS